MRVSIIASSIIDDAKVAKRVHDKISVTFILMVHRYLRSLFLGVFMCLPFSKYKEERRSRKRHSSPIPATMQFV